MFSAPLLADTLILRCDAKGEISFSVSIDPTAHAVHSMGFATKVETDQFSDTVIAATGQFQLSWTPVNPAEKGASYQGSCAPARRLF